MATPTKELLIDGDGIIYRCGFACERSKYLYEKRVGEVCDYLHYESLSQLKFEHSGDQSGIVWSRILLEPVENGLQLVNAVLDSIRGIYSGYDPRIFLSPPVGNFREQVAQTAKYKGNRDYARRPTYFRELKTFLVEKYGAIETAGQEADDALGISATSLYGSSVIVSFDKDLLQVPGTHYNWVTKEETKVTPKEGYLRFWIQTLAGDAVDNVPGIVGVGPKTAEKMLAGCKSNFECWEAVKKAYEQAYGDKGLERAIETGRLVWIRRKEGEIWQPPSRPTEAQTPSVVL